MDTSSLSPTDAAVALRSFPRRFRETTDLRAGEVAERMYERNGLVGRSIMDLAVDAVRTLTLMRRAFQQIRDEDLPVLHPAVLSRRERDFDTAAHRSLDEVLVELDDVAPEFADEVERVHGDDWTRIGTVAGSSETATALRVVQEAVATAADDLRDIDATMRQFRGS